MAWKALERPGIPWKGLRHRTYRGLRPINTAYLPTVDSVVENIVVVYRQSITTNHNRARGMDMSPDHRRMDTEAFEKPCHPRNFQFRITNTFK